MKLFKYCSLPTVQHDPRLNGLRKYWAKKKKRGPAKWYRSKGYYKLKAAKNKGSESKLVKPFDPLPEPKFDESKDSSTFEDDDDDPEVSEDTEETEVESQDEEEGEGKSEVGAGVEKMETLSKCGEKKKKLLQLMSEQFNSANISENAIAGTPKRGAAVPRVTRKRKSEVLEVGDKTLETPPISLPHSASRLSNPITSALKKVRKDSTETPIALTNSSPTLTRKRRIEQEKQLEKDDREISEDAVSVSETSEVELKAEESSSVYKSTPTVVTRKKSKIRLSLESNAENDSGTESLVIATKGRGKTLLMSDEELQSEAKKTPANAGRGRGKAKNSTVSTSTPSPVGRGRPRGRPPLKQKEARATEESKILNTTPLPPGTGRGRGKLKTGDTESNHSISTLSSPTTSIVLPNVPKSLGDNQTPERCKSPIGVGRGRGRKMLLEEKKTWKRPRAKTLSESDITTPTYEVNSAHHTRSTPPFQGNSSLLASKRKCRVPSSDDAEFVKREDPSNVTKAVDGKAEIEVQEAASKLEDGETLEEGVKSYVETPDANVKEEEPTIEESGFLTEAVTIQEYKKKKKKKHFKGLKYSFGSSSKKKKIPSSKGKKLTGIPRLDASIDTDSIASEDVDSIDSSSQDVPSERTSHGADEDASDTVDNDDEDVENNTRTTIGEDSLDDFSQDDATQDIKDHAVDAVPSLSVDDCLKEDDNEKVVNIVAGESLSMDEKLYVSQVKHSTKFEEKQLIPDTTVSEVRDGKETENVPIMSETSQFSTENDVDVENIEGNESISLHASNVEEGGETEMELKIDHVNETSVEEIDPGTEALGDVNVSVTLVETDSSSSRITTADEATATTKEMAGESQVETTDGDSLELGTSHEPDKSSEYLEEVEEIDPGTEAMEELTISTALEAVPSDCVTENVSTEEETMVEAEPAIPAPEIKEPELPLCDGKAQMETVSNTRPVESPVDVYKFEDCAEDRTHSHLKYNEIQLDKPNSNTSQRCSLHVKEVEETGEMRAVFPNTEVPDADGVRIAEASGQGVESMEITPVAVSTSENATLAYTSAAFPLPKKLDINEPSSSLTSVRMPETEAVPSTSQAAPRDLPLPTDHNLRVRRRLSTTKRKMEEKGFEGQNSDSSDSVSDIRAPVIEGVRKSKRLIRNSSPHALANATAQPRSPEAGGSGSAKPQGSRSSYVAAPSLTNVLCKCRVKENPLAVGITGDIYCKAVDSFDGRMIGCCNIVTNHRYLRVSGKIPFILMCDIHRHRLRRHNCCPCCGLFCTQGIFYECSWDQNGTRHYYHKLCALLLGKSSLCPHCGTDQGPREVRLELKMSRKPVIYLKQQQERKESTARISWSKKEQTKESEDIPLDEPSLEIDGSVITAHKLPLGLDKQRLQEAIRSINAGKPFNIKPSAKGVYWACKQGDLEKLLHLLISGVTPNIKVKEYGNQTGLHVAATYATLAAVHVLAMAGASLDMMDTQLMSPLMVAIVKSHNDIVLYLIQAGASLMAKNQEGMTSLHLAAKCGNFVACQYILDSGRLNRHSINMQDEGGWTPLVWASENRFINVVKFLLDRGGNPQLCDVEQNTALHWAAFSGSTQICSMLLDRGCSLRSMNAHGDTPLHIAARQNHADAVVVFLARGARLDILNSKQQTPLDCAVPESDVYLQLSLNCKLLNVMKENNIRIEKILSSDIAAGKEAVPIPCVNGMDDDLLPKDYLYIAENCEASNVNIDRTITSLKWCECEDGCNADACDCGQLNFQCWYDPDGRLLPEFNYADPPMIFECNRACRCNKLSCNNRVVQHGISAHMQLFKTNGKGWGVRALKTIQK
ncbi:Histone-lysine N-methyltransferase ehmt1, partial [Halocaridina rubra]